MFQKNWTDLNCSPDFNTQYLRLKSLLKESESIMYDILYTSAICWLI